MNTETHRQLAGLIWQICNLLRGPYKGNEYRTVILPLTVLRRFNGLLAPTKTQALARFNEYKGKPESIILNLSPQRHREARENNGLLVWAFVPCTRVLSKTSFRGDASSL